MIPTIQFNRDFLAILVAIIGTSLSPIYIHGSRTKRWKRDCRGEAYASSTTGTAGAELKTGLWDVIFGMLFSNVVMSFIILGTAATLFAAGHHKIDTATDAAQSLRPLAGDFAGLLFSLGIIGVGFLAVPVMIYGRGLRSVPEHRVAQRPELQA